MLSYPINMRPDTNGTLLVTFPDVPEAITVGKNEDDARAQALDALEAALEIYFAEKREIPRPSRPKRGQQCVTLPIPTAMKALLTNKTLARRSKS